MSNLNDDFDNSFAQMEQVNQINIGQVENENKSPLFSKDSTKKINKSTILIAIIIAIIIFASVIGYYLYNTGMKDGARLVAPTITSNGAIKVLNNGVNTKSENLNVFKSITNEELEIPQDANIKTIPNMEIPSLINTETAKNNVEILISKEKEKQTVKTVKPIITTKITPPLKPIITTKPVATKPVAPKITVPKIELPKTTSLKQTWRVQTAAFGDKQKATKIAEQTNKNKFLRKLIYNIETAIVNKKTYYRIRFGPLSNRKTASNLCNNLKKDKIQCLVIKPN